MICGLAATYADFNVQDDARLVESIDAGRTPAVTGV
jgi:hypothetical protein